MRVLITGGAGFIGSHTLLHLLDAGHDVVVVDNLSTGHLGAIERAKSLTNRIFDFVECDIRNRNKLGGVFSSFQPQAVVHFAGLKSVSESFDQPALYYDINVGGTAVLLDEMDRVNCKNIVFSSSATVYGDPLYLPCDENHPLKPINPYGRSKLMSEEIIHDWIRTDECKHAAALRYFNPVGAHPSGQLGELTEGVPNNLMPFITQVAAGQRDHLQIFGNDYPTKDGTGVRDYIHVSDLARAHVLAVENIGKFEGFEAINIGTGRGISVMEMLSEFEKQSGCNVNFKVGSRRLGDAPEVWADISQAAEKIGFIAELGLAEMCCDTWNWHVQNPQGY